MAEKEYGLFVKFVSVEDGPTRKGSVQGYAGWGWDRTDGLKMMDEIMSDLRGSPLISSISHAMEKEDVMTVYMEGEIEGRASMKKALLQVVKTSDALKIVLERMRQMKWVTGSHREMERVEVETLTIIEGRILDGEAGLNSRKKERRL